MAFLGITPMKTLSCLFSTEAIVATLGLVAPAMSETVKQTVVLVEGNPVVLACGWRATDIIGADVDTDAGEKIGKLDDRIITASGTFPYVVVSVAGFLGRTAHHVVVAATALDLIDKKLTLDGAMKDSVKVLPDFTFAS
jgi:hypothetical protein